jgi:hypothetical protein
LTTQAVRRRCTGSSRLYASVIAADAVWSLYEDVSTWPEWDGQAEWVTRVNLRQPIAQRILARELHRASGVGLEGHVAPRDGALRIARRSPNMRFGAPERSPGFVLWRAMLAWQRRIRAALAPYELTHVQFVMLAVALVAGRPRATVAHPSQGGRAGR